MRPWLHRIDSPVGPIQAALDLQGRVAYLGFAAHEPRERLMAWLEARASGYTRDAGAVAPLQAQLDDYFAGRRRSFDLPLALEGTAFRKRVWAELLRIPFGETRAYGELAARLGDPGLSRAVGTANGANPVSILVPCHRVIGAGGSLTGYAGGLGLKEALLRHEGAWPPRA